MTIREEFRAYLKESELNEQFSKIINLEKEILRISLVNGANTSSTLELYKQHASHKDLINALKLTSGYYKETDRNIPILTKSQKEILQISKKYAGVIVTTDDNQYFMRMVDGNRYNVFSKEGEVYITDNKYIFKMKKSVTELRSKLTSTELKEVLDSSVNITIYLIIN